MRISFCGVVGAIGVLASASAALADSPWYVSGSVGGYFRQDFSGADNFFHSATPTVTVPGTDRISYSPGVVGNIAVGYHLTPHIRVEGELGYVSYDASALHPYTTAAGFSDLNGQAFKHQSGDTYSRFTGSANAFYDFSAIAGRFTPYVGAGVGGSANHKSAGRFEASSGAIFTSGVGATATEGLAMVEGGVAIAVTRHLSLVPGYRFVHYFSSGEDVAHVAKLGLRYSF